MARKSDQHLSMATLMTALIGAIATVVSSTITARWSVKSDIDKRVNQSVNTAFGNLRPVDIQSGLVLFSRDMPGWNLDRVSPPERLRTVHVAFPRPFSAHPKICVAMRDLDEGDQKTADSNAYSRILVYPSNDDEHGFDLTIQVWNKTRLYSAAITWIAFEQVAPPTQSPPE